jgi:hypothetical protein
MRRHRKTILIVLVGFLLALYVYSYLMLSRQGHAQAPQWQYFWYCKAEDSDAWRLRESICQVLFAPLNILDQWSGFGRPPGSIHPTWGISK